MIQPAFDHRVGARFAVFLKQMPLKRSCVHADADRTVVVPRGLDDFFHTLFVADVAGVDPQTCSPSLGRFDTALVVEMDVRHDGHRHLAHNLFQGFRRCFVRNGDSDDIRPRIGGGLNLRNRCLDVRCQRVGHRLDGDRRIAPNRHVAHHDLTGFAAVDIAPGADVVQRHERHLWQRITGLPHTYSGRRPLAMASALIRWGMSRSA